MEKWWLTSVWIFGLSEHHFHSHMFRSKLWACVHDMKCDTLGTLPSEGEKHRGFPPTGGSFPSPILAPFNISCISWSWQVTAEGSELQFFGDFFEQKPREIQPPQWLLCHETAEKMAVKGCGWMIRIIIPESNNSHGKAITPNSYTYIAPLWDIAPRFILMASNSRQPIVFLIALRPLDKEPLIQKPWTPFQTELRDSILLFVSKFLYRRKYLDCPNTNNTWSK